MWGLGFKVSPQGFSPTTGGEHKCAGQVCSLTKDVSSKQLKVTPLEIATPLQQQHRTRMAGRAGVPA